MDISSAARFRETMAIAEEAGRGVQSRFPELFKSRRVPVEVLASRLGVPIVVQENVPETARLERFRGPDDSRLWEDQALAVRIRLQASLQPTKRRFAIAHELGHAILWDDYAELASRLPRSWLEELASRLGIELLVAYPLRETIRDEFRGCDTPLALIKLAGSLGLSARTLLSFAWAKTGWFAEHSTIWLDVRYMANLATRRDPKLRIFRAYFDYRRLYVPRNRSTEGLVGSVDWLLSGSPREAVLDPALVRLSYRDGTEAGGKFRSTSWPGKIRALRLIDAKEGSGPQFLIAVLLDPTQVSAAS